MFNPLDHPICFSTPKRFAPSAWHEHIPFGMAMVDMLRPKTLVELGTQYGVSYCAFCQAVLELKLDTQCFAIDTWQGDPHSGFYGDEVLIDLRDHHDALYATFSHLIRSTFDDARNQFLDASVDLLHIDGYHTYETVSHDFNTWFKKLSDCAVVLLHDTNMQDPTFGVRRFWLEIKGQFPHFEFLHEQGLGVLGVGKQVPNALRAFFASTQTESIPIRDFFSCLGSRLLLLQQVEEHKQRLAQQERKTQELAQELAAVYGSRPWRITKPIRAMRDAVRAVLRRD